MSTIERISIFQLFTMTVFYQLGTTVIFGFASSAGRDAWLVTLLSTGLGILLILLDMTLVKLHPGLTLVEWFPAQLGRWIGVPIAWLYALLFLYATGRVISDLKGLVPSTLLPGTPNWFILAPLLLIIMYCVASGVEVLARLTEYLLPVMLCLFLIEIILLFGSGIVSFHNVQPIVGQGWERVGKAIWPAGITQTFAETLSLAMIWPLVTHQKKITKTTICATIVSGLTISVFNFMEVAVLGEDIINHTIYPLYVLVRQISIADFLENLDAIVALNMIITAYIKVTINFLAAVRSIQLLLNIRNSRYLIFLVALITYTIGITMSRNINEHIYVGMAIFPLTLWVPLLFLPYLLLIVALVRKLWTNRQHNKLQKNQS